MLIHDCTITLGETYSRRQHETRDLVRGAVEVFRDLLERRGDSWRGEVHTSLPRVELAWTRVSTVAIATFWWRSPPGNWVPVTTSALVPGRVPDDDARALREVHEMLRRFLPPGAEAGYDLLTIRERPLLATALLPTSALPGRGTLGLIADAETCLAAAFFELLQSKDNDAP